MVRMVLTFVPTSSTTTKTETERTRVSAMAERVLVTSGFFLFSGSVLLLCVRRKRDRHRLWRQRVTLKKISKSYALPPLAHVSTVLCGSGERPTHSLVLSCVSHVVSSDLGHCFGLDIGAFIGADNCKETLAWMALLTD